MNLYFDIGLYVTVLGVSANLLITGYFWDEVQEKLTYFFGKIVPEVKSSPSKSLYIVTFIETMVLGLFLFSLWPIMAPIALIKFYREINALRLTRIYNNSIHAHQNNK